MIVEATLLCASTKDVLMPSEILQEAGSFHTLEQVMQWAFARKPPAELSTVVTQDEFTHDVVIRVDNEVFLVFDTT